ncbi:MAG: helix-turn-helix domain-containing protein [Rhodospirillales bacterium]|nr:helix-turn-helix domain-containing protein [Rhodospirillales bacterium]
METPTLVTTTGAVLGQTLVVLRKAKNLRQSDLAAAVGVSPSNWSRIEKGEATLSVDQLRIAADFLDTTSEAILGAAREGEIGAVRKGLKVVVGAVGGGALAGSIISGASGAAFGVVAGSAIPVIGTVLGGLIGSAIGAYLERQKSKDD